MRKLLLFLLFTIGAQVASGQIFFREIDTATGTHSTFDLETHFQFVNMSEDTTFVWRRFDVDVPDGFTTAVCDVNLCYPVEVSTAEFNFGTNDSFTMITHFYPDNNCGKGSFKLLVYAKADTTNRVIGQIFADVWCLSVRSMEVNALKLYPNPASTEIEIAFGAIAQYDIAVYNMHGQKMLETSSNSLIKNVDVSGLKPGMYAVAVQNEGRTFTQTFIRQ